MSLRALTIESYKCFDRKQTVELRPLTVLLGRNNAGKSALARLPAVVSTGMRTGSGAPIEMESLGIDVAGTFTDLIFGHRPHGSIHIGQRFETESMGTINVESEVQNIDEYQIQLVSRFVLSVQGRRLELNWDLSDPRSHDRWYEFSKNGSSWAMGVHFAGLLPEAITPGHAFDHDDLDVFLRAIHLIRDDFPTIRYVGPFRHQPHRYYRLPARAPDAVGVMGEATPTIVADDRFRRSGLLVDQINAYFRRELPGWLVDVDIQNNLYSLVLASTSSPEIRVNLVDTGTGIAQALPILVQRAMDGLHPPARSTLEIIEQPELHLHPAGHAALADLYIAGVKQPSCSFIVETHSETFILRLRRRIAEGSLDPDKIALYFVDHDGTSAQVRHIELDRLGNVENWPDGIFTEDYREVRALADAQNSRM